jgi:triosephosphate isomerase
MRSALDHHLLPVLCVGETIEERRGNRTDRVLRRQLESGFAAIEAGDMRRVTVAYEPVWAIGTGDTATPEQAAAAHQTIRKWIATKYGAEAANTLRILYGGSVRPDNIRQLMATTDVDGVLVGGASLKPDQFIPIIEFNTP